MEVSAEKLTSAADLDSEMIALRHMVLRVATIGGLVTSAFGLIVVAGEPDTGVPHLAVQGLFVIFGGLAAVRALFPSVAAYQQAALLFCCTFTLGFAARTAMSFLIAQPELTDDGIMPRFAAWATLPLIVNFLFLPRRHALILSLAFYLLVAAAVLNAAWQSADGSEFTRVMLSMLLFYVFVGIPFSIGMLAFFAYSLHRYRSMSYLLEAESRQRQHESECDDVTNCLNRRGLLRRLEGVTATERGLLAAVEVDNIGRHLKILGGTGAHTMLAQLGRKLKETVAESAVVARWDSGRFYVYLPMLDEAPMVVASQLLEAAKGGLTPVTADDMTLSIGACVISPGSNISDYIEEVDLRLFLAQSGGGNCIRMEIADTDSG